VGLRRVIAAPACSCPNGFSLQAAIVVVCIAALMLLALAAFKLKRSTVYAQQIDK
jgi:hypothetical protein